MARNEFSQQDRKAVDASGGATVGPASTSPYDDGLVVRTHAGSVKGEQTAALRIFKGIPYAAPPVGPRRFLAPEPAEPWSGIRDATSVGPSAVQNNPDQPAWQNPKPESEDCLRLHVWTPARSQTEALPVLVWLHGGGFTFGSGWTPGYDGARLAEVADVVVVSVNHRLNVFGYCWLGDAVPELAGHPNVGQQDIVAALRWVRDNIHAFGGNPGNVTVFGQSGGGAKIGALLATPTARGLLHKAIIASGSKLSARTKEEANEITTATLAALGGGTFDLHRLQALSHDELRRAAKTVEDKFGVLAYQPVADGRFLPGQTWTDTAPPESRGIPMIIGTTAHEAAAMLPDMSKPVETDAELEQRFTAFDFAPAIDHKTFQRLLKGYRAALPATATCLEILVLMVSDLWMWRSALIQAERKLGSFAGDVFFYEFAWRTPCFGDTWALHGVELPFIFGNLTYPTAWDGQDNDALRTADDPTGQRFPLSDQIMRAWGAFARHGDPSTDTLRWPKYNLTTRPTLVFGRGSSTVENDLHAIRRQLIDRLPTVW